MLPRGGCEPGGNGKNGKLDSSNNSRNSLAFRGVVVSGLACMCEFELEPLELDLPAPGPPSADLG